MEKMAATGRTAVEVMSAVPAQLEKEVVLVQPVQEDALVWLVRLVAKEFKVFLDAVELLGQ